MKTIVKPSVTVARLAKEPMRLVSTSSKKCNERVLTPCGKNVRS